MKYLIVMKKMFKSQFQYTDATLIRLGSAFLAFFIQVSLWTALLSSGESAGTTVEEMVVYVVLTMFVSALTSANIATMLEPAIRDGSVAYQFLRPTSFKYYCFSEMFGKNLYQVVTSTVPVVILVFLFYRPQLPSLPYGIFFLLSLVLGCGIMLELTYIFGLLAFFTQRAWYINWYLEAFSVFFGGTTVPLWFYPQILNQISYFLPFRYVSFEPINFFLERTDLSQGPWFLLIALFWILVLKLVGAGIYRQVEQKLSINGG